MPTNNYYVDTMESNATTSYAQIVVPGYSLVGPAKAEGDFKFTTAITGNSFIRRTRSFPEAAKRRRGGTRTSRRMANTRCFFIILSHRRPSRKQEFTITVFSMTMA